MIILKRSLRARLFLYAVTNAILQMNVEWDNILKARFAQEGKMNSDLYDDLVADNADFKNDYAALRTIFDAAYDPTTAVSSIFKMEWIPAVGESIVQDLYVQYGKSDKLWRYVLERVNIM